MDTNENENADVEDLEEGEEEQSPEPETEDPAALKARIKKLEEKAIAQRERLRLERQKNKESKQAPKDEQSKTGELDETQLDYLDLKGITEDEDIKIIERHVQRTGETIRQALKDEYVQSKLDANKAKREVSAATPSATKRSGNGGTDSVAIALAKYERTGELPTDFALRSAVVNAKAKQNDPSTPPWQR